MLNMLESSPIEFFPQTAEGRDVDTARVKFAKKAADAPEDIKSADFLALVETELKEVKIQLPKSFLQR